MTTTPRRGVGRPVQSRSRAAYSTELDRLRRLSTALSLDNSNQGDIVNSLIKKLNESIMIFEELIRRIPPK